MAFDAVTLIMNDHRLMETIFDRLRSGGGDRQRLLDECAARLTAHSHAEEQHVYPALAELGPVGSGEAHRGADEHHEAERLLHDLQRVSPAGPDFDDLLEDFIVTAERHIEREETEWLPALAEAVPAERLVELGAAFEEVRIQELAVAGIRV